MISFFMLQELIFIMKIGLGKLKITDEGINKRDQIVIENFYSKKILYVVFLAVVIIKVLINL